jgi:hypothetical protein
MQTAGSIPGLVMAFFFHYSYRRSRLGICDVCTLTKLGALTGFALSKYIYLDCVDSRAETSKEAIAAGSSLKNMKLQ